MNILSLPRMVLSSQAGWPELEETQPSIVKIFAFVLLPLSLIPPAMLYYAGLHYGDAFMAGVGDKQWGLIAVLFFLAEIMTFAAMGWLIQQIAENHKVDLSAHDAYLLAGIAPVPMWLSALGLFVPNLIFSGVVALVGLALSCSLIYRGVFALCHMHEDVVALSITYSVIAAGLTAWAFLLVIVMVL